MSVWPQQSVPLPPPPLLVKRPEIRRLTRATTCICETPTAKNSLRCLCGPPPPLRPPLDGHRRLVTISTCWCRPDAVVKDAGVTIRRLPPPPPRQSVPFVVTARAPKRILPCTETNLSGHRPGVFPTCRPLRSSSPRREADGAISVVWPARVWISATAHPRFAAPPPPVPPLATVPSANEPVGRNAFQGSARASTQQAGWHQRTGGSAFRRAPAGTDWRTAGLLSRPPHQEPRSPQPHKRLF